MVRTPTDIVLMVKCAPVLVHLVHMWTEMATHSAPILAKEEDDTEMCYGSNDRIIAVDFRTNKY